MAENIVIFEDEGIESGVLSAVFVEAEGEAVVMGVLGAVSVAETTVLLKLRVKVLRLDCLALCS